METPAELRVKAARYRKMAVRQTDQRLIDALNTVADEYDALADQLERQIPQSDGGQH